MPSRHRPRRPDRRPTAALHPTRPRPARPAPRPRRSRRPTAAKAAGVPRQFRDTGANAHVLEQCALPGCTSPPVLKNKGAHYCCSAHRLKHWRMKKRAEAAAQRTMTAMPAERPTTPTRARLTPPTRVHRTCWSRRGLTPRISRCGRWRGSSSTWRRCSSSTPATRTLGPGCGSCVGARPSGPPRARARMRPSCPPT